MKLTDDMEGSTPPLDYVGAQSPPVTDAERGASFKESPEQSDGTLFFVAGTSVILKGLSTVQYNGPVGKILSQGAAATQNMIKMALGPTFNKLLAARDGSRGRWHGDPNAERRDTQLCRGHQSVSQRSHRTAVQRSGRQDFEKLHHSINTGQDTSGPIAGCLHDAVGGVMAFPTLCSL